MDLKLPIVTPEILKAMLDLRPWSHYFKLDDQTYTGFFGDTEEETMCWAGNSPETIEAFKKNYESIVVDNNRQFMPIDHLRVMLGDLSPYTVLDIGCNDGMKSFYFKQAGATSVRGVEIREDCVKRARYISQISGIEVDFQTFQTSADDIGFLDEVECADIVASFGVLHHLEDHLQHIKNLKALAKRAVVLFTACTKSGSTNPLLKEDREHPFKSFSGTRIVPDSYHILEMMTEAGFSHTVEIKFHPKMGDPAFTESTIYLIAFP